MDMVALVAAVAAQGEVRRSLSPDEVEEIEAAGLGVKVSSMASMANGKRWGLVYARESAPVPPRWTRDFAGNEELGPMSWGVDEINGEWVVLESTTGWKSRVVNTDVESFQAGVDFVNAWFEGFVGE